MCQELAEQFRGAIAPEDDMMELMGMKQEEHESLRDFVKRYHRAVLDLGAFNHPQALRGLKGVRIGRLWYNLRSPLVQNYSAGYEQARQDIEIEEEKSARIKSEQLEELRRKERRVLIGKASCGIISYGRSISSVPPLPHSSEATTVPTQLSPTSAHPVPGAAMRIQADGCPPLSQHSQRVTYNWFQGWTTRSASHCTSPR
ncbi:hypothetical protein CUMW_243280 [Citrus unshiu]|nr:hypothetical protein CUMW_243280 [Citrus unshiu]